MGQTTTDRNRATLHSLFGMKFTHKCPANRANELEKYKQQKKYGCMQRRLPAAYPAKAVPPFGSSNNELHSCRLSIAEKAWSKQLTGTEQHSPHCSV
jgi:hypothetical protein